MKGQKENKYLTCETRVVFELLMMTAGMMGAYTFNLRGGVFSNAQTANIVLMSIAFGKMDIRHGFYYLIPISAYLLGAVLSEILPKPVKKIRLIRWDTLLIFLEMLILYIIGFIPLTINHHVVQIMINFICAMQHNTFRQAESIPMTTTLCTNHLRQVAVWCIKYIKDKDNHSLIREKSHISMIAFFFIGGLFETIACRYLNEKGIWVALIPLSVNLFMLIRADLIEEKNELSKVPLGH